MHKAMWVSIPSSVTPRQHRPLREAVKTHQERPRWTDTRQGFHSAPQEPRAHCCSPASRHMGVTFLPPHNDEGPTRKALGDHHTWPTWKCHIWDALWNSLRTSCPTGIGGLDATQMCPDDRVPGLELKVPFAISGASTGFSPNKTNCAMGMPWEPCVRDSRSPSWEQHG